MKKFSIIIPTLNSPTLRHTVESLANLDVDPQHFEVIVVGMDDFSAIEKDYPFPLTILKTDRPYAPAEARNLGARQAAGEILVFLDSDCLPTTNWLSLFEKIFMDSRISAAGGGVRFDRKNYWNAADNFSIFHEFLDTHQPGFRDALPSLNLAIRKSVFQKQGGFNEGYPDAAGEDFEFTRRINQGGDLLFFTPEAWIFHNSSRKSFEKVWKHSVKMGKFSTKLHMPGKKSIPAWARNRVILFLAGPLIALLALLNIYLTTPKSLQFLLYLPVVYLQKIAWVFGAVQSPWLKQRGG